MKLTDIMMWFEILMDFDVDFLLRGERDHYLYREQSQGQKIQRGGRQAKVKGFKVAREFVPFQRSNGSAGHSMYAG